MKSNSESSYQAKTGTDLSLYHHFFGNCEAKEHVGITNTTGTEKRFISGGLPDHQQV